MQSQAVREGTAPQVESELEGPTAAQRTALRVLGVAEARVRPAAFGPDLFAYVEQERSTLRLQITPTGGVVGQTVLKRGPTGARGQEVR